MNNNEIKKSKIEIVAYIFTIIGIISAIIFSGHQAYYLRKDFNANMRPYIKIDYNGYVKTERKILGITIARDNYFMWFEFEKDKKAQVLMPLQITNVGKMPGRIKEITWIIRSPKRDEIIGVEALKMKEGKSRYVIFPNETLDLSVDETFTPETAKIPPNEHNKTTKDVEGFNKYFEKIQNFIKTENFACQVIVRYEIFNENKNNEIFTTYKVWTIQPEGKKGTSYYYTID
jgi:hypothetical protein